jgi:hypothetical protein
MIMGFVEKIIQDAGCNPLTAISATASVIAVVLAIYIPRRIMLNQAYLQLTAEYRSPEMGAAILGVFHFYTHDCGNSVSNIGNAYHARYQKESALHISQPAETLHFQRRLIAQYYYDMASLRYDYRFSRLTKKQLQHAFTPSETLLLSLILHMAEPASQVFERAENVIPPDEPGEDDAYMNKLLHRLYEETEGWE